MKFPFVTLSVIFGLLALPDIAPATENPPDLSKIAAREKGKADATENISNHIYGLQITGDETGVDAIWLNLLQAESLEFYIVSANFPCRTDFIAGYNDAIRKGLTKRYGYDLLERTREKAKKIDRLQRRGAAEARTDIKKGRLKFIEIGLPADWAGGYYNALTHRYGIRIDIRGCTTSDDEEAVANGYNTVMVDEVKRKFGKDVIDKTVKEFKPEEIESEMYKKGAEAARQDIAKGLLKTYEDTKHPDWMQRYCDILRANGIAVEDFNDAAKKIGSEDYCRGYCSEMDGAITQEKGWYFTWRAHQQAQREFAEKK